MAAFFLPFTFGRATRKQKLLIERRLSQSGRELEVLVLRVFQNKTVVLELLQCKSTRGVVQETCKTLGLGFGLGGSLVCIYASLCLPHVVSYLSYCNVG